MLRGVFVAAALAFAPSAAADVFVQFQTPSHNIACVYVNPAARSQHSYIRCDIGSGLRPRPAKPRNCDLDWGNGVEMTERSSVLVSCAGDTVLDPKARVLTYGHRWARDGFSCVSKTTGLTCRNPAGHGFFLSRQSWRHF